MRRSMPLDLRGGAGGVVALHWPGGAARCVKSTIPGALSILTGAVPGRARGLGHMAPTYFRREPGIERSHGHRGSALLYRPVAAPGWSKKAFFSPFDLRPRPDGPFKYR